jgi:hypothetical protein
MNAPGDGSHLARCREPDGPCRQHTAADGDPEGQGIASGGVVQCAGHPRPGRPARDSCQHQRAKDGPIVRALEDLGRDGPDDWAEPIAEAARLDGTISGTLMYRFKKASLAKYLTGTVTICN